MNKWTTVGRELAETGQKIYVEVKGRCFQRVMWSGFNGYTDDLIN